MRAKRILGCILALSLLAAIPAALAETSTGALSQYNIPQYGGWHYSPIYGWVWMDGPVPDQIVYYPGVGYIFNDDSRPLSWPYEGAGKPKEETQPTPPAAPPKPQPVPSHNHSYRGILTSTTNAKVYEGPGTKNEVLGNVQSGEQLEIISWDASGAWVRVYYNNHNNAGWIQAKYTK